MADDPDAGRREAAPRRDDVEPADALGGAAGLPLPGGQPRGFVPTDRDAPGSEAAPEALPDDEAAQARPDDEAAQATAERDDTRP